MCQNVPFCAISTTDIDADRGSCRQCSLIAVLLLTHHSSCNRMTRAGGMSVAGGYFGADEIGSSHGRTTGTPCTSSPNSTTLLRLVMIQASRRNGDRISMPHRCPSQVQQEALD